MPQPLTHQSLSQPPLISVVVPVFNRLDLLRKALDSVFRQTFRDFELIVVDDGSTEDLSALMVEHRDRATFLRQKNAGPGAARNRGAGAARGEYVAFLDSDDVWFPWTLAAIARSIRDHCSPAILSGRVVAFSDEADLAAVCEEPLEAEAFVDYLASGSRGYSVGAGTSVLQRTEFLRAGGFVEEQMNAEDHDLVLRMGTTPGFVKILQPPILGYRQHAGSLTSDFRRTSEGTLHLVRQELRGLYPGGRARSSERHGIICRHVRPVVVECLQRGMREEARRLYWTTFRWHVALGRWRFLLGIPVRDCFQHVRDFWSHCFQNRPDSSRVGSR